MVGDDQARGGTGGDAAVALREAISGLAAHLRQAAEALDKAALALADVERSIGAIPAPTDGARLVEAPGPDGAAVQRFSWESDAAGTINWVQGAPRASVIGHAIGPEAMVSAALRRPFRDQRFHLPGDGAMGGEWRLEGGPLFDATTGRLLGLGGTAQRPVLASTADAALTIEPDMMRQFAHEIRTPLNAILGFAGMIEGEHLGPAGPAHRARAAEIVRHAEQLLDTVEALDAAAKRTQSP